MSVVATCRTPITREGYERLQAELEQLVSVDRVELADWLRDVRADGGDPMENPHIADAHVEHALLERRIDELQTTLAAVEIAEPPVDGVADIGQVVRLGFGDSARVHEYELVGAPESDPAAGRISVESPVGGALLGHRAGDSVDVATPSGPKTIHLLGVGR